VDRLRPVDRESHQEAVFGEEGGPLIVDQGAVGLDGVHQSLPRQPQRFGEFDGAAEEVQAHHRRLAALPPDNHFW